MTALALARPAELEVVALQLSGRLAVVRELDRESLGWNPPTSPPAQAFALLEQLLGPGRIPGFRRDDLEDLEEAEAVELHPVDGPPVLLELLPLGPGTGPAEYPAGPYRCGLCREWAGPCSSCREEWRGYLAERAQEADWRSLQGADAE